MKEELYIKCAEELVTSHEQTRAGFIEAALAKNYKAKPYIVWLLVCLPLPNC